MAKEFPGRSRAVRRVSVALVAAAAGIALVAGCAAGQDVQSINQQPPVDGASANAGDISIRTAAVRDSGTGTAYPVGGDAPLQLVIINNGAQPQELTAVSTPVASDVLLSPTGVPTLSPEDGSPAASAASGGAEASSANPTASTTPTALPGGNAGATSSASGSASGSSSPVTSATATESEGDSVSSSAAESAPPQSSPIDVPPGESVQVGFDPAGPAILLTDLTTALYPAQTVPVTFSFASGISVTVNLTVQLSSNAPSAPVVSGATSPEEPKD